MQKTINKKFNNLNQFIINLVKNCTLINLEKIEILNLG